MKTLDYKTACIIAGYEYQITDGEKVYNINRPGRRGFAVVNTKNFNDIGMIYYSEIGTKYWILARPISCISEKIIHNENIIVPDKYLYSMVIGTDSDMYGTFDEFKDDFVEMIGYNDHTPYCLIKQLLEWHFAINLEPEWWKPISPK